MYKLFILAILLSSCAASYPEQAAAPQQVASLEADEPETIDSDKFTLWLADYKKRAIKVAQLKVLWINPLK